MKKFLLIAITLLSAIAFSMKAENKTVVEGRYWNYGYLWNNELKELKGFHFKGTIEINKKIYSVFRDTDEKEVAYMRESHHQVYLYCGENAPTDFVINLPYTVIDDELLIYDFTLIDNTVFETLSFGESTSYQFPQNPEIMECYVIKTDLLNDDNKFKEIDFKLLREMDTQSPYSIHYFIEGIGCIDGFLPFPCIEYLKTHDFSYSFISLLSVEDEQGNIIFRPEMLSGTNDISNEHILPETSSIFDLHGREVTNPIPGSIYIRNGKKFVAK